MQAFLNQLLNQARAKAANALPDLPSVLRQSVGTIDDVIVRPATRFSQELLTKPIVGPARTFRPGKKAEQLVREQTGRFVPTLRPPASLNAPRYNQSAAQRFFQEFGGAAETTARTLIGQSGLNQANSMVRSFSTAAAPYFKPSSAFARVPVPGWAQPLVAPTSVAGTIFALTQLEGSTPQSGDPYDNWQRLGYSSKDDMIRRVTRQAQIENSDLARGSEQYGPPISRDYKKEELEAGAAAEAFRPGAGFPGQQQFPGAPVTPAAPVDPLSRLSPQDRAYQQERARVEAMVKSNPDMQKEEIAAARAKVRDQGMAIWAANHKDLAKQVKPGQSGYEAIQQTLYPGGTPVPTLSSESEAMLNVIAPANQQGVRPNVTPMPGQLPSFGSATEGMFNAITAGGSLVTPMPQELIEKYKEQLLKQAK